MNDYHMEYITLSAIKKAGNITAACKTLFISQPALSQRLSSIEANIGCPVFNRDVTPLKMTFEGELYYDKLKKFVLMDKDFKNQLYELKQNNTGRITLAMSPMRTQLFLVPLMLQMKQRLPNVDFKLVHGSNREELYQLVLDGSAYFMINSVFYPSLQQIKLCTGEELLALPPSHPYAKKFAGKSWREAPAVSLHAFSNDTFILHYASQGGRKLSELVFQSENFFPSKYFKVFDYYTILQLIQAEMGCSVLTSTNIAALSSSFNITYLRPLHRVICPLYISFRKGMYLTSAMNEFVSLCKSVFSDC